MRDRNKPAHVTPDLRQKLQFFYKDIGPRLYAIARVRLPRGRRAEADHLVDDVFHEFAWDAVAGDLACFDPLYLTEIPFVQLLEFVPACRIHLAKQVLARCREARQSNMQQNGDWADMMPEASATKPHSLKTIIREEEREIVRGAIRQLPVCLQEVIALYYYGDLASREIAYVLDQSIETVIGWLLQAKTAVANLIHQPL